MADNGSPSNYRSPLINEPNIIPTSSIGGESAPSVLRTPFIGNVRVMPPPIPALPMQPQQYVGSNNFMGGFRNGYGALGGAYGGYGGLGVGYGGYGGYSGIGNTYGNAFSRFGDDGMHPMDPEARFIQLAEASSRPAFQSIESLVSAIGNIATMLDSTFFALTSSFRAILGVAANFGRLRSVFAQFWQTFAIFRGLTWIYRKILYWLHISKLDPSSQAFKKAFAEAVNLTVTQAGAPKLPQIGQSPWPVVAFLSFIFTAPYLIMKLLGTVTNTAQEETRNPAKWINPIETIALYDFEARNPNELTIHAGERILIAPKEIQNTQGLLNTGWGLATINLQESGIVPINYVKSPQQMRQEHEHQHTYNQQQQLIDLSKSAFAAPPSVMNCQAAKQVIEGPPSTAAVTTTSDDLN